MHEPYRQSLEEWVPQCDLIYDKFHIMQHANLLRFPRSGERSSFAKEEPRGSW